MSRIRSPAHPDVPLPRALDLVGKLHAKVRSNAVDRETAVKEMGYSGMTGASGKMLANLVHYGLVAKAAKGTVRVTQLAVDILHPKTPEDRRRALHQAGFSPTLFRDIRKDFADGMPTATWLRSFLIRRGFAEVAIEPASASFLETCHYLQQENAYESHGAPEPPPVDSAEIDEFDGGDDMEATASASEPPATHRTPPPKRTADAPQDLGERTVFREEGTPGQYIALRAAGEMTDDMLEALEDYVKRQRKRLARGEPSPPEGVSRPREKI